MESFLRKPQVSQVCKYLPCAGLGKLVWWGFLSFLPKKKVPKIQGSSLYVPGVLSVALKNLDFLLNFSTGSGLSEINHNALGKNVKEVQETSCKDYRVRWLKIVWGFESSGTATSPEALEHFPSGGWELCPSCTSTAPLCEFSCGTLLECSCVFILSWDTPSTKCWEGVVMSGRNLPLCSL